MPDVAAMFIDEGAKTPLGLIGLPGQTLVAGGHADAFFEPLLPQERQQRVEVPLVARDPAVGRQEFHPVLEVREVRDHEAIRGLDGSRELEGDVPGRSSAYVAHHYVDLRQARVVGVDYDLATSHGGSLGAHLLEHPMVRPVEEVVPYPQHLLGTLVVRFVVPVQKVQRLLSTSLPGTGSLLPDLADGLAHVGQGFVAPVGQLLRDRAGVLVGALLLGLLLFDGDTPVSRLVPFLRVTRTLLELPFEGRRARERSRSAASSLGAAGESGDAPSSSASKSWGAG